MDIGLFFFFIIVALIVRGLIRSVNTVQSSSKSAARRQQLQQIAQRMRATAQQNKPGFPEPPNASYGKQTGGPGFQPPRVAQPGSTAPFQPPPTSQPRSTAPFSPPPTAQQPRTAAIAPPSPPFTARWPTGAPTDTARPPDFDPVVVEVAADPAPESAYPTDEPTSADRSPDTTTDIIENATPPTRRRYELSSSLDTTLSTSLTSSVIGEPGTVAGGPQAIELPPNIRQQVLEMMNQGYEVMAVRLVCDEMGVGILDAHKTVRSIAGLPTLM